MRPVHIAVLLAGLAAPAVHAAEIRVITPGVIGNSGLRDVAADFTRATGVTVIIEGDGMGTIMNDIRTRTPAADVVMLPMELAGQLDLEGGLQSDTLTPLGRVEMGLFAKPGAPHPDISTPEKLTAAMQSASVVFYTDPKSGSMQAGMSGRLMARAENANVHGMPIKGDAEPALRRGDGDQNAMGLGLVHGPHPRDGAPSGNPYLVGPLPAELGMHLDMMIGVSARSVDAKNALAFVRFIVQPQERAAWKAKGTDRY